MIKVSEETNFNYGFLPTKRPMGKHISYGVINLDKPPGPTSHEVVAWVKRLLGISKAGHGGTLDPGVTGVLPLALERATKIIGFVMHSTKEYMCVIQTHEEASEEDLRRAVAELTGTIYQRPPLRSNVKRTLRRRTIYEIEVIEFDGRKGLLRVSCDAGTYMRKLCWDIGLLLGTGAHMRELRRVRTGPFSESWGLVRLQELSEAVYAYKAEGREEPLRSMILPVEYAVCNMPKIVLRDSAVESIVSGAKLAAPGVAAVSDRVAKGERVALMTLKGELVAVARALMSSEEIMSSQRGIVAESLRVIMEPGLYPRAWKGGGER